MCRRGGGCICRLVEWGKMGDFKWVLFFVVFNGNDQFEFRVVYLVCDVFFCLEIILGVVWLGWICLCGGW